MKLLVTGGCGFIGSNFLNLMVPAHPEVEFTNWDALKYSANPHSLDFVEKLPNYEFVRVDLADSSAVDHQMQCSNPDAIVHFAAETHVDRSIRQVVPFLESNVLGTAHLLQAFRSLSGREPARKFVHISTDEVFGSIEEPELFTLDSPYRPQNPYAASKAAADHFVRSYAHTYGVHCCIINCSNNYGPMQQPEKLIPLMTSRASEMESLPVYGLGLQQRDWLYVNDHCELIWQVIEMGDSGSTYLAGTGSTITNIEVVTNICATVAEATHKSLGELLSLIEFVNDRPGHDMRYAIDASQTTARLGWKPTTSFELGLKSTVQWYLQNPDWLGRARSADHELWMKMQYGTKGGENGA